VAGGCLTSMSDSTDMNRPGVSSGKGESDSRTDSSDSLTTSNQQHPHEPSVPPITRSSPSAWSSAAELDSIWESMVKVTLASFGGSLVGLALENQRRHHHHHHHDDQHQQQMRDRPPTRRRPPTRQRQPPLTRGSPSSSLPNMAAASLPGQWALSCLFFAMAMEASRHASPTTLLLKVASNNSPVSTDEWNGKDDHSVPSPDPCYRTTFLTSFSDYAIGGAVSGMAGGWALASRQPSSSSSSRTAAMAPMGSLSHAAPFTRRAGLVWGLRVGAALGVAAGIVQAAVDVAGVYYDATQQQPPGPATAKSSSQPQQAPPARGASVEEGTKPSR
jgi:hypothetical protein